MSSDPKHFKGWAKPGPEAPGYTDPSLVPEPGETLDAISGHFRLFQLKEGHRFSTDDLLTAWYGTTCVPSARTVLDLGSGIGSVATIAAWRLQGARLVTVEAQTESVRLAKKSALFNGLSGRYEIRHGDFRDPAMIRPGEKFDLVLGSPPYFPLGTGMLAEHPQKMACRFEMKGDIQDYCQTASKHLEPGGVFACVFPISPQSQKDRVFEGARKSGLIVTRFRPVVLREDEAPLLGLFILMHSEDLPNDFRNKPFEESALIIRRKDGSVDPEYSSVKLSIGFPP